MKIIVRFALAVLFALLSTEYALATADSYNLWEPGITIDIPEGYYVYTRDSDIGDSELTIFGITMQKLLWQMEWNNLYLDAEDKDRTHEISVVMTLLNPDYDFSTMSEHDLDLIQAEMGSHFDEETDTIFTKSEYYKEGPILYIKSYATQRVEDSINYYILSYYTVHKGKAIIIRLVSFGSEVSLERERLMRGIVESVIFHDEAEGIRYIGLQNHTRSIIRVLLFGVILIILMLCFMKSKHIQQLLSKPLHRCNMERREKSGNNL